jgi:hypothetical protein
VGRYASAIAFLVMLTAVLGAAGCGQRFDRGPGDAPAAEDLAADALAALEAQGSAHFVADVRATQTSDFPPEVSLHLEGDASATALDAEGSVSFGVGTLSGRILVGEHDFFVRFMDQWYGEHGEGIAEAVKEAKSDHHGAIWNDFMTPEGLRRTFDDLFDGDVGEGPVVDGAATWQFDGRLDADGVAAFARRYGAELTDRDKFMLDKVASASRFLLVVGRDDSLPRRVEFSIELSEDDLREMAEHGSGPFESAANFKATLELSEFGKPVELEAPVDFKPLEALFEELFAGLE